MIARWQGLCPKAITERLDDVIGSHSNVGGTAANHTQNRPEHAAHRSDLVSVPIAGGRQGVVVAKQLVCAVDQMNVQAATPRQLYRTGGTSINRKVPNRFKIHGAPIAILHDACCGWAVASRLVVPKWHGTSPSQGLAMVRHPGVS
jgi:hypothetical protein